MNFRKKRRCRAVTWKISNVCIGLIVNVKHCKNACGIIMKDDYRGDIYCLVIEIEIHHY